MFQEAMQRLGSRKKADLFISTSDSDQAAGKEGVYRACSPCWSREC